MTKVIVDMGITLDGYVAGPNRSPSNPMGDRGTDMHQWVFTLHAWRERQGRDGGVTNRDNEIVDETMANVGAYVMGRNMFDEGEVAWPDPPPFNAPVFVLTRRPREPWVRQGGTTFNFVTEGIESALDQAKSAADGKDVRISGGGNTVQQYLNAGFVDELQLHLAPILLGDGVRLFESVDPSALELTLDRVVESPLVTHLRYKVTSNKQSS